MGLHISWSNECDERAWIKGQVFSDLGLGGHIISSPKDQMQKISGSSDFEMDVTGSSLENYGAIFCVYWTQLPKGIFWYAIQAYQPVNYLSHIGWSTYWQICSGNCSDASSIPLLASTRFDSGQNLWRTPVGEPSETYDLNSTNDGLPAGLKIECIGKATSTEDLLVTVTMSDVKIG